jgi:hypothetical protein
MKKYIYITIVAVAVVALAVGGWIVRPSTIRRPRYA